MAGLAGYLTALSSRQPVSPGSIPELPGPSHSLASSLPSHASFRRECAHFSVTNYLNGNGIHM